MASPTREGTFVHDHRNAHPTDFMLQRLADGGPVGAWRRARLERHLDRCDSCSARLRYTRAVYVTLRRVARDAPPSSLSPDLFDHIQLRFQLEWVALQRAGPGG
jgi:hypothetical protein